MFVQFTIPRGTVELGRIIDTCVTRCVERWGGCTVADGIGYWRNPESESVVPCVEPVAILGVECDTIFRNTVRTWFDNLAVFVRIKGNQHTVYYRMFDGGESRFVGPDTIIAVEGPQV